jgi:hypothetical protein
MRYITILIILVTVLIGCNQETDLSNFDENAWKQDIGGCNSVRLSQLDALEAEKDKIKSLNQDEVIALLGKPDENELYKRSQKFFIYYITPKNCDSNESKEHKFLSIRFTAMGLAKEVLIYTE